MSFEVFKGGLSRESADVEPMDERDKIEILGDVSDEKREEFYEHILAERQKALEPLEGELAKEGWQLASIELINSLLADKAKELGLSENRFKIQPVQIHILSRDVFDGLAGNSYEDEDSGFKIGGFARVWQNAAFVPQPYTREIIQSLQRDPEDLAEERMEEKEEELNEEIDELYVKQFDQDIPEDAYDDKEESEMSEEAQQYWDFVREQIDRQKEEALSEAQEEIDADIEDSFATERYGFFKIMLHESIHVVGMERYYVDGDFFEEARIGYEVHNPYRSYVEEFRRRHNIEKRDTGDFPGFFESLNEAVVDKMSIELTGQYEEGISEVVETNGTATPWGIESYEKDIVLFERILEKVAQYKNENVEETWKRFQRRHFEGNLGHLRDIERACGRGVVRLYSTIRSNDEDSIALMMDFLEESDEVRREEIAERVFESTKKYKKRHVLHVEHQKIFFQKRRKSRGKSS